MTELDKLKEQIKTEGLQASIYQIDKGIAAHLLDSNGRNRKKVSAHQKNMRIQMEGGDWMENGEAIIVASDGLLNDGQHRLEALLHCVTDFTYKTVIVTGAAPKSISTIDRGKSRSLGDILTIEGIKNSSNIAALVNHILPFIQREYTHSSYAKNRGGEGSKKDAKYYISASKGLEFAIDNEQELQHQNKENYAIYLRQPIRLFTSSYIGLLKFAISRDISGGDERHEAFIKEIIGVNSQEGTATQWLYRTLIKASKNGINISSKWIYCAVMTVWNHYNNGNLPVDKLTINMETPEEPIILELMPVLFEEVIETKGFYKKKSTVAANRSTV